MQEIIRKMGLTANVTPTKIRLITLKIIEKFNTVNYINFVYYYYYLTAQPYTKIPAVYS